MNEQTDNMAGAPEGYNPGAYPPFAATVDIVYTTIAGGQLCVLLVQRGRPPHQGQWALPGGFIRPDETAEMAARRELAEETGVEAAHLEQLATYTGVQRDPRMRVISVAYVALTPDVGDIAGNSDAADAQLWPVVDLDLTGDGHGIKLAFDHGQIVADGIERVRAKLEYTTLATAFCNRHFTITELRHVYEAVWGMTIEPPNFYRKIVSSDGLVVAAGAKTDTGGIGGGRRAQLYMRGPATEIYPALRRTSFEAADDTVENTPKPDAALWNRRIVGPVGGPADRSMTDEELDLFGCNRHGAPPVEALTRKPRTRKPVDNEPDIFAGNRHEDMSTPQHDQLKENPPTRTSRAHP